MLSVAFLFVRLTQMIRNSVRNRRTMLAGDWSRCGGAEMFRRFALVHFVVDNAVACGMMPLPSNPGRDKMGAYQNA